MGLILLIVVLLLLFGGGGYYGYNNYGPFGGIVPAIILVFILLWLIGRF